MQLTSVPLLNIILILIFSIITFTIKHATTYMKRKKATRITISFKCTDFVKLNLIELTCISFSFMSFNCAIIFLSFDIAFTSSLLILQNICLNNSKKILSNLQRRILINVFNICLRTSIEFDYSLMICANLLNFFKISTTSTELNLINFIFLYLTIHEFKLMSTEIPFVAMSTLKISIILNFF